MSQQVLPLVGEWEQVLLQLVFEQQEQQVLELRVRLVLKVPVHSHL
jgi:hypothetical protein